MTSPTNQQERRALNEGIETAFLDTATHAAGMETNYQTGRGAIMEIYEMFYFNFNVLHKLTAGREEMESAKELSQTIRLWFRTEMPPSTGMTTRCYQGIDLFDAYHSALTRNGLLSLPARGR